MVTTQVAVATMKVAQVSGPGADFQIVEREVWKACRFHLRHVFTVNVKDRGLEEIVHVQLPEIGREKIIRQRCGHVEERG